MTQTLPTFGAGVWSLMLLTYSSGLCHASAKDYCSPANSDSQSRKSTQKLRKCYAILGWPICHVLSILSSEERKSVLFAVCLVYTRPLFAPEVARGGAEVAVGAGYGLQLAQVDILLELAVRGAHGIVADAGKLAHRDVGMRLEVFV